MLSGSYPVCGVYGIRTGYSIMMEEFKCNRAVKRLRTEVLQMSQSQFAKAIGIRRATVSDWERGETLDPSLSFTQAIALDKLLSEKGLRLSDFDE